MSSQENGSSSPDPHSLLDNEIAESVLRSSKGPKAKLTSWKYKDFTKAGDNYMTIVTCLKIKYLLQEKEDEESYVVKLSPMVKDGIIKSFQERLFYKEAGFYTDILPDLNKCLESIGEANLKVPSLVLYRLDECREIVVMKDLREEGFKMFDRKKGIDLAHTNLVMKELARLHAASVVLDAKDKTKHFEEKFVVSKDLYIYSPTVEKDREMVPMFVDGSQKFLAKTEGYENVSKWIEGFKSRIYDCLLENLRPNPPFVALCHGDCWNNNFLFRYNDEGEPVDIRLVDMQIIRWASPATDMNYFFYSSFSGETRREHLNDFFEIYYQEFSEIVEKAEVKVPFTLPELKKEFRSKMPYGLIFSLMIIHIVLADESDVTFRIQDVNDDNLLEKMGEVSGCINPSVAERLLSMIDEMVENKVIDC